MPGGGIVAFPLFSGFRRDGIARLISGRGNGVRISRTGIGGLMSGNGRSGRRNAIPSRIVTIRRSFRYRCGNRRPNLFALSCRCRSGLNSRRGAVGYRIGCDRRNRRGGNAFGLSGVFRRQLGVGRRYRRV
ncbi:MAG: hypothetical protein LBE84_02035, partial [Planctomycetota bacterium]|nr:hypothetical protein [Planctomycetota bacterium]